MGDVAVCLRGLNHARASSMVGRVVWRAVTRGCYPVETIVELCIKATLGDTTTVFMYPQDSMGYGDGVVGVSWRGRVERVAMLWTWRRWHTAMATSTCSSATW